MNYNLDTLSEAYKQADLKPKPKEEEYFLYDHKNPVWRFLFPLIMTFVGAIICLVGWYE